jgi:hypothetical protein
MHLSGLVPEICCKEKFENMKRNLKSGVQQFHQC